MSENKQSEEMFDLWLTANLKTNQSANPAFSQNILREIEHAKAQKLLRKTVLQERITLILLGLFIAGGIGLLLCIPVLKGFYPVVESGFYALTHIVETPKQLYLGIMTLILFVFCLAAKALLDKLSSET